MKATPTPAPNQSEKIPRESRRNLGVRLAETGAEP